ncbi:hypothetical protein D9758_000441 [Tetrapyrgos nigripes]|uniref:Uncharacterized protein n=1 Tax=Tetrapyrgos nigripes TaxID=182062 RepID=A0A8H5H232_9AGAR|nr:hypothetical protein D9758_000441 [Tetrapyrgos nigripes]
MTSIATRPSTSSRGEIILDPAFFTSSLFVDPFRDDIWSLVQAYHELFSNNALRENPFTLFKKIWCAQGWDYMHFKVLEARSREAFLRVCFRLFLERTVKTEALFTRVVALFGLYTFFNTQPSGSAPPLQRVHHIPIPLDHYASLLTLPTSLVSEQLIPLKPAISYILGNLVESKVFHIVPNSDLGAQNPRFLPREISVDPSDTAGELAKRGPGRPTRNDSAKRSMNALAAVEDWMQRTSVAGPPRASLTAYQQDKSNLLKEIETREGADGSRVVEQANLEVLERLRQAQATVPRQEESWRLIERVERAGKEKSGLLGLTEGAGSKNRLT